MEKRASREGCPFFICKLQFNELIWSYIIEKQIVELALNVEEVGGRRESQGPIPTVFRCRTYGALQITHLHNNSPIGLPY